MKPHLLSDAEMVIALSQLTGRQAKNVVACLLGTAEATTVAAIREISPDVLPERLRTRDQPLGGGAQ